MALENTRSRGYAPAVSSADTIAIEGLTVDCVVGVYPHERHTPQPLRVDLYLEVETRRAAQNERLSETVNYDSITDQVVFLLRTCRFGLLETAAHTLSRLLLSPPAAGERRAQVEALRLRLTKPRALGGRAVPSLEIRRNASSVSLETEESNFGHVDIVHETREAGVYRLNVAPRHSIPLHMHKQMDESEMVLSDGLLCQGSPIAVGTVHRWPKGARHRYDNPTDDFQTILCVDSPPFIQSDEIEVEGEPDEVDPVSTPAEIGSDNPN